MSVLMNYTLCISYMKTGKPLFNKLIGRSSMEQNALASRPLPFILVAFELMGSQSLYCWQVSLIRAWIETRFHENISAERCL